MKEKTLIGYEEYLEVSKRLNDVVNEADDNLKSTIEKVAHELGISPYTPIGLISKEVRDNETYKLVKIIYDKSFKSLREFNSLMPKKYHQKKAIEIRQAKITKSQAPY